MAEHLNFKPTTAPLPWPDYTSPAGITVAPPPVSNPHARDSRELDDLRRELSIIKQGEVYAKTQTESPTVVALKRAVLQALNGAVFGLWIGLQMGSRDWSELAWGALIGAAGGFIGRNGEARLLDSNVPKVTKDTTVLEIEKREANRGPS